MYVVNHYGYTNGSQDTDIANKTDKFFHTARAELKTHPPLPTIFLGDANATEDDLPTFKLLIEEGWTDLGECAGY